MLNSEPSAQGPLYLVASPYVATNALPYSLAHGQGYLLLASALGTELWLWSLLLALGRAPLGIASHPFLAPGLQGQRGGEVEQPRLEHWTNSVFFPFRRQGLTPVIFPTNTKSAPR